MCAVTMVLAFIAQQIYFKTIHYSFYYNVCFCFYSGSLAIISFTTTIIITDNCLLIIINASKKNENTSNIF